MAVYVGFNDIAKDLIRERAQIDAWTVDGQTPLNLAERNRHDEVARTITNKVDRLREEMDQRKLLLLKTLGMMRSERLVMQSVSSILRPTILVRETDKCQIRVMSSGLRTTRF